MKVISNFFIFQTYSAVNYYIIWTIIVGYVLIFVLKKLAKTNKKYVLHILLAALFSLDINQISQCYLH